MCFWRSCGGVSEEEAGARSGGCDNATHDLLMMGSIISAALEKESGKEEA